MKPPPRMCGQHRCVAPSTHAIVHCAQMATVADDSAGEEAIRVGLPPPDVHIEQLRNEWLVIDWACRAHREELEIRYKLILDAIAVLSHEECEQRGIRIAPDAGPFSATNRGRR